MEESSDKLILYVNGKRREEDHPCVSKTLLQYLRRDCLTGTKNACDQGGCGACTVMASWWNPQQQTVQHSNINACLAPLCYLHGYAITTVEGVGNHRTGLHPIQESMVSSHGIQCGYCTPGMVMSVYTLIQNDTEPSQEHLERSLEGNLCRCTGYRPIVDAFKPFCNKTCATACSDIEDTCTSMQTKVQSQRSPADDSTFPSELKEDTLYSQTVKFVSDDGVWIRPVTLEETLRLVTKTKNASLIMGGTAIGYNIKMGKLSGSTLISCSRVQEMNVLRTTDGVMEIGAAVTLSHLNRYLGDFCKSEDPGNSSSCCRALIESLRWLAADQVKNTATIGGHLVSADPRSDLCPVLMVLGASAVIASPDGVLELPIDDTFFLDSWKTRLSASDVLVSVKILISKASNVFYYKQSKRKAFDYAIANACFFVTMTGNAFHSVRMCFGGVGKVPTMASKTALAIQGQALDFASVNDMCDDVTKELNSRNGQTISKYKLSLVRGFVRKFVRDLTYVLKKESQMNSEKLTWPITTGTQVFEPPPLDQPAYDAVGKPIPHVCGRGLVSGEAMFANDLPQFRNEVWVEIVTSTRPHAKILSIEAQKARDFPGVVEFMDASSIPGSNKWGLGIQDESMFENLEVQFYGQPVGAIVAESEEAAKKAARLVQIEYEDLPFILTLEDAIRQESYFDYTSKPLQVGDPDKEFDKCDFVNEGVICSGYQEHMYMEPNAAVVIPKNESDEIEIFTTTQSLTFCQETIGKLLKISSNRIIARQKRVGGAFGGKEQKPMWAFGPAALAAYRTGRPARCVLDRKTDFAITGKRHPFRTEYKVGFNKDGEVRAIKLKLYIDAGATVDTSPHLLSYAIFHVDGSYKIPHFYVEGHVCRTNTASNTSFRGFGGPEGTFVIETVIADVANILRTSPEKIRIKHLYKEGDETHFKKVLDACSISRCWTECEVQSNYKEKEIEIEKFNKSHDWRKRGIAMVPCKLGMAFPVQFLNQGGAFMNVYMDGSVLLAHGGIEMGQGLNTKMIQVASRALGIPIEKIYISETGTNTVPNTMSTSASYSSDLYGAAVLDACQKLRRRLEPVREKNPDGPWEQWVIHAYLQRINLSVTGHSRVGNQNWNHMTGEGDPFLYFTFGVGCSVVEIDRLTGEHQVLSTDIVMDVGKSINPAIDIGQIEGAFVQGYGWITMEDMNFEKTGKLNVNGPVDYKIPNIKSIPRDFRVSLLKDCPNEKAVYSSKGIGEPPLTLSITVYMALRKAINAARASAGICPVTELNIPLTAEVIRTVCPEN